ncbi:peptidylprolyl isomerase [Ramlibacter sp.]|uniref:peptidylprolyl isomerase n=1 Tax=Ramlibacter sp. TaxID=1917967 RepID=UPI002FC5EF07
MIPALTRRAAAGLALLSALAPAAWAQAAPRVKFTTSAGEFVLELHPDKAPKTVENFLQYVRDGHYNGTIFHRVIDGFMIQGGGFTPDMQQKPTRTAIPLETRPELKNDRGTIAMARTANPNSATAQFFINVVDNKGLNAPMPDGHGYAVFGKVVSGMDVVDKIKGVATGSRGGHQNVPATPVVIQSAAVLK